MDLVNKYLQVRGRRPTIQREKEVSVEVWRWIIQVVVEWITRDFYLYHPLYCINAEEIRNESYLCIGIMMYKCEMMFVNH